LDLVVGVDDKGHAVGHTLGVERPGGLNQFPLDVGKHRERHSLKILVPRPPLEVHELAVHRHTQDLRVPILELVVQLGERGDLGRADESEVFRPEEHHAPFARVIVAGNGGEVVPGLLGVHLGQIAPDQRGEPVSRKLITDGEQCHINSFGPKFFPLCQDA
jgi:hypothetical protein